MRSRAALFRHAGGFAPDALESPLAALDCLPRSLWLPGITNSVERLGQRLDGLDTLRRALLEGALPQRWTWPVGHVLEAFARKIVDLGLARYCEQQENVADQVLRSMLWHVDRIVDYRDQGADECTAVQRAADRFSDEWKKAAAEMEELLFVFGEFGDALKIDRWDATRGLLRSNGWQDVLRLRRMLEQLPELRALIRQLGRARKREEPDASHETAVEVVEQITSMVPCIREVVVPDLPGETRGVRRSGAIARMLAAEAVLLRHPQLRLIWFARHAERTLLTYEENDVLEEAIMAPRTQWRPTAGRRPDQRLEMGPIIVCVDTSASMQGACEQVAKAVVLEAMRTAHSQKRGCHVFAFSGPGEVVERELPLDPNGIARAIDFLGQSFHGGTDVSEPLERAVARLHGEAWRWADLLIASDGEFGATREVVLRLRDAKEDLGVRVQGVLIGDRETIGMREICDDIFWVRDWRRFGHGGVSPVHSKNLTLLYFPNALR